MESDLKDKGADVPSDGDLNQIKSKINSAVTQANDYVKGYKSEIESKKKEAEAEKEEQFGGRDPKNRSQKDKDEMSAFLGGASTVVSTDWPYLKNILFKHLF